jgi:linearmycin/streptolysin S transport system permease protein
MRALWAIAAKDLRVLARDPMGLFFALGFPILMALFFGFIFGGGGGAGRIAVGLVDEDGSEGSRDYLARLQGSAALEAKPLTLDEARNAVRRGKLVAYIRLTPGFGDLQGFFPDLQQVEVGIDPSRTAEKGILQGLLVQTAFQGTQSAMGDSKRMAALLDRERRKLAIDTDVPSEIRGTMSGFFDGLSGYYEKHPEGGGDASPGGAAAANGFGGFDIRFASIAAEEEGPRSSFEITFPPAMLWGLLGCTASFALSLVNERTTGTLQRLRLAPLGRGQVLAGKALACGLGCLAVLGALTALGHVVFKMRVVSWPLFTAAAVSTALCFVGIMMFVSVLGKTPRSVSGSGWAIFLVMSMFGGGTVPLIAMPPWMQKASSLSPVKWGIVALEGAIWRGFSWREMALPCGVLLAVGALGLAIGVRRMRRLDAR